MSADPKSPRGGPRKTRKRRALTRDKVLEAAVMLANDIGIEALSMRKLAKTVGVEAMSLYNHVKNKDDLLDGMVEHVLGQFYVPTLGGNWRDEMRQRAHTAYTVLKAHPWAAVLIMSRVNIGPSSLRYVDATIGCLLQAGFPVDTADHAWNALDSFIYGYTLQELNFPFEPDEYATAAEEYQPMLPRDEYPHLVAMSEAVFEGRHDGLHRLEFGLALLLDGLERMRG